MSICKESSLGLLEMSICYDQSVLLTKFCSPLPCFILYSKAKLACYSRYLLASYFCILSPMMKRTFFFGVSSRRCCDLYRTSQLQLLYHQWLGYRLGLLWCWMVCLRHEQRYCHFWGCTQGLHFRLLLTMRATPFLLRFLPTVVVIMVIWIKFAHSCPF